MIADTKPLSQKDEIARLQDKVRIMQKYGSRLNDEEIEHYLEQERRIVRRPEEKRLLIERQAADLARYLAERKKIALDEFGKRIVISLNRTRARTLSPDATVPCPDCGSDLKVATDAFMEVVDMVRGNPDLYSLIARGQVSGQALPCIHTGGPCAHCGAGVEVLVQLVL